MEKSKKLLLDIQKNYPDRKITKELKNPKYYKLLCRLRDGYISVATVNAMFSRGDVKGVTLASLVSEGRDKVYTASYLCFKGLCLSDVSWRVIKSEEGVIAFTFSDGYRKTYLSDQVVFVSNLVKRELPYDMRLWPKEWVRQKMTSIYNKHLNLRCKLKDPQVLSNFRTLDNAEGIKEKLVQIRRINPRISRRQSKKIASAKSKGSLADAVFKYSNDR